MASTRNMDVVNEGGPDRAPRLRFTLETMDEDGVTYTRATSEGDRNDVLNDGLELLMLLPPIKTPVEA